MHVLLGVGLNVKETHLWKTVLAKTLYVDFLLLYIGLFRWTSKSPDMNSFLAFLKITCVLKMCVFSITENNFSYKMTYLYYLTVKVISLCTTVQCTSHSDISVPYLIYILNQNLIFSQQICVNFKSLLYITLCQF